MVVVMVALVAVCMWHGDGKAFAAQGGFGPAVRLQAGPCTLLVAW